jgi:hypothetical protein
MAFKYGTTSPTAIKYNGTDLTVLKYGTTPVWGKPYSLTITKDSYTTVTVNRTSSPNQGASTGTLSSGSVVYYGDVLKITYSVSSGYKISTSTVNGTTFSSGATFTVTGAISVVTTAVASASWHTVWTGSKYELSSVKGFYIPITGMVSNAQKTRITFQTGVTLYYEDYWTGEVISNENTMIDISAKELGCGFHATGSKNFSYQIFEGQSESYTPTNPVYIIAYKIEDNKVYFKMKNYTKDADDYYMAVNVYYRTTLTKVEQYY